VRGRRIDDDHHDHHDVHHHHDHDHDAVGSVSGRELGQRQLQWERASSRIGLVLTSEA
jgi:hypothetical protein